MNELTYVIEVTMDKSLAALINAADVQPCYQRAVLEVLGCLGLVTSEFHESVTKEGGVLRTEEYTSNEDLIGLMNKHGQWERAPSDDDEGPKEAEPGSRLH